MRIRYPGESAEYRAARDRLLEREIELRRATEAVAAERRALPAGGVVPEDYVFQGQGEDGNATDIRLSELFAPGKDSLVIYSMMFPRDPDDERPGPNTGQSARLPLAEGPCPSCTALLDPLDGAADHVTPHVNLAAVAKTPVERDRRRSPTADAERLPPRQQRDPPLLGLRALLRTDGRRTRSPPRRHDRAGLELVRPHPRRTRRRLG